MSAASVGQGVGILRLHRLGVSIQKSPQSFLFPLVLVIMSQYPIPPPSYGSTSPSPRSPKAQIYSSNRYQDEPGPSVGIYNQPPPGDLPDDFKVRLTRFHRPGP